MVNIYAPITVTVYTSWGLLVC